MYSLDRPPSLPASIPWSATLWCCLAIGLTASAQEPQPLSVRVDKVVPGGGRTTVTESWGTFDLQLNNWTGTDRLERVVLFYDGQTDVQYGKDVWVPAHSTLSTWMLVGPAAPQASNNSREIQILQYERSEGKDHLVLPQTEERVRGRGVLYQKREPFTAILVDEEAPEGSPFGRLPQPDSAADEAYNLAQTFRAARGLSGRLQILNPGPLPATAETLNGVDHFVLASGRLAHDPAGLKALRHWLMQGGKLWVMLDVVEPDVVAPLLGDALDFQVVDRLSLTDFEIRALPNGFGQVEVLAQHHERPVDVVRVLLPPNERAPHTVHALPAGKAAVSDKQRGQGWPAWFSRQVGRGKVVFSTLGPRGWFRPRGRGDPPSPYQFVPNLPMPTEPLALMAEAIDPPEKEAPFPVDAWRQPLVEQIGYTVLGRGAVLAIFGAALLFALVVGFVLRKSRRPELLGWLGPAVALGAAGTFLAVGEWSHQPQAALAVGQVVYGVPGTEEAPCQGLLALYRPASGPVSLGVAHGGLLELDMAGLQGQTRRLIQTDLDAWHWENLALPGGVRFAPFQQTVSTGEALTAVAHIGPDGLEGKLTAGPFRNPADALLATPAGRNLAVHLLPDGTFRAGSRDTLPPGQFLASGAVLSDRQQRRQQLYREFLKPPGPRSRHQDGGSVLLAWAEPADMHFTTTAKTRTTGAALLVLPLRLERSPPGTAVIIPAPLISCQRVEGSLRRAPTLESAQGVDMHLRFQLPPTVLPLKMARARLVVKINAPSRQVTVTGRTDNGAVQLRQVQSPLDPVVVDITEDRFLRLDGAGGLLLDLAVSTPLAAPRQRAGEGPGPWRIEYLELEVAGRTGE